MQSKLTSQTFIFFGIAGSGKGTQAKLLEDFLKTYDGLETVYFSSGVEYRKITESETQTSLLVKDILYKGWLVPDFLTNSIFSNVLINEISSEKHLITDGYPRTFLQSQFFERSMQFYDRKDVKIIYIELSEAEGIKRMKLRGRTDDTDAGITRRLDEYVNKIIPAMDYFKGKDGYKIYTINGDQTVENVHKDIIKYLGFE